MPQITRRYILVNTATLALPTALRAQSAVFDADVAIVGAGAAGLAAARQCQQQNLSFVVLEARQRIGGRVFTDLTLGEPFDAGASYIHWAERNPWSAIARDLGVATVEDKGRGSFQLYEKGRLTERSPSRRAAFDKLSELLDDDADDVPDVSLVARVSSAGEDVVRAAGTLARMSLGEEPERVSAKDYARLSSGDDLLVPAGYGTLVTRFGANVPVRLGMMVQGIDTTGPGVALSTSQGTLSARYCVVTVPVGVLAAGGIAFTPPLPLATREAMANLPMGNLAKIALKFDGARFGIPEGADLFDLEGPRAMFDLECWAFGRNLVVAYVGGDHGRAVFAQGRDAAIATALDIFAAVAGSDVRKAFVRGTIANWAGDPLALGSYSHVLPGHAVARTVLAEPVSEKLWFAGEATGGAGHGGAMTAGGAFLAGKEAVLAIAGSAGKR